MAEISAAPEPLAKLVWRFDKTIHASPLSIVVDNSDEATNEQYAEPLTVPNSYTTGENVHIIERYLLEVLIRIF